MGRSTKTSVRTTSKNKKKKKKEIEKMAQKRKALTLDLNAAASSVGSSGLSGGFSKKVQISSLTYFNITRCTKIEVILARIGRISYKESNFSHSYTIWRQLYFSKNCY